MARPAALGMPGKEVHKTRPVRAEAPVTMISIESDVVAHLPPNRSSVLPWGLSTRPHGHTYIVVHTYKKTRLRSSGHPHHMGSGLLQADLIYCLVRR